MGHLVAAHLAGFQTRLGPFHPRRRFTPQPRSRNPTVAFHIAHHRGIGRHEAVLRLGRGDDTEVVHVKLIAPTLVRFVLRFEQASQIGPYGSLLAGVGADLAP